jgi:hypothetical protein
MTRYIIKGIDQNGKEIQEEVDSEDVFYQWFTKVTGKVLDTRKLRTDKHGLRFEN